MKFAPVTFILFCVISVFVASSLLVMPSIVPYGVFVPLQFTLIVLLIILLSSPPIISIACVSASLFSEKSIVFAGPDTFSLLSDITVSDPVLYIAAIFPSLLIIIIVLFVIVLLNPWLLIG